MIPQRDLSWQTQSWQEQLINAIQSPEELLKLVALEPKDINLSVSALGKFPLLVPRAFASRIRPGNKDDPLLRQVLNFSEEDQAAEGYGPDPLEESSSNPVKGLIRKYHNRALLIVSRKCAINCRYCFRREFPYDENNPNRNEWDQAFSYLAANPEIDEVVLSGGDPLAVSDKHLQWLVESLSRIDSIKFLRLHTRLPVVLPDRVTDTLLNILGSCRFTTSVVLHCNHANEIDPAVSKAAHQLKQHSNFLLNQSVLLKGVNDDIDAQIGLQKACADLGILPYYLHFLDPVTGTSHFEVTKKDALSLYNDMQKHLSGYMLPKLMVEVPNTHSKQFLT